MCQKRSYAGKSADTLRSQKNKNTKETWQTSFMNCQKNNNKVEEIQEEGITITEIIDEDGR